MSKELRQIRQQALKVEQESNHLNKMLQAYDGRCATMPAQPEKVEDFDFIDIDFPNNQFVFQETQKVGFVLHHSAGWDNARNMFSWWARDKAGRVATAYGIEDNGDVFRGFDGFKYWGYAINARSSANLRNPKFPDKYRQMTSAQRKAWNDSLEKKYIQLEICNWGGLVDKGGKIQSWAGATIPDSKIIEYKKKFRGFRYFERYTDQEIESLEKLLKYHNQKHGVPINYNADMWDVSDKALSGFSGIWAHVSFRFDKSDVHPQPELIEMLKGLS